MRGQAQPARTAESDLALQSRPIVVKLGGSVVRSQELPAWLDVIAASPRPIIIVPGGGAFADEVHAAQAELGFGDGAAHRMALLAMDQLAWAVTSDSLALWLARRVNAGCCYVIKSIRRQRSDFSAAQLARDGVVDEAFPAMLKDASFRVHLLGRGDQAALAASLSGASATACGAKIG